MRSPLLFGKRSHNPARGDDTRSHLLVEAIEDGVLHVRGEGPRIVLEAGGVNFDLKAESEQRALLDVMAELLSYLPGPLQILVPTCARSGWPSTAPRCGASFRTSGSKTAVST